MGVFIPFGEWLPDQPDFENPGATIAKNVVAAEGTYIPFPKPSIYSTSLGGRCQGAFVARDSAGNYINYSGDASALYASSVQSWTNTTRTSGAYSTGVDDFWEFTQFGDRIIAVNGATGDRPQFITAGGANFANLSGSPPAAEHIATVRDFVVLGNISATAAAPQAVRWCAINNSGSWSPDTATLADFQDLPGDGGWIQKIVGGENGTIFQERAIWRMAFVGTPLIFQFDKIHNNIGAYISQSVVSYRNLIFFLSVEGFCMLNVDDNSLTPIGKGKVDRTFFNELSSDYKYRITTAIDPVRKIVAWAYPGPGNSNGNSNRILVYNWSTKRWTRIEDVNIQLITRSVTGAYTLDSLNNFNGNIELLGPSLDSPFWSGGNYNLTCFDSGNRLNVFNGSAMAATVDTPEVQLNRSPDGLAYVTEIRPVVQGNPLSLGVVVATRNILTTSASYGASVSPSSAGFAGVRATGRYHRFRLTTTADQNFDHLHGVDVTFTPDGVR